MKRKKLGFWSLDLFRNITILTGGTIIAQSIPVLLQPVLRRLFTPEVFGNYAIYLSIIGIVAVVVSFRYEMTILLPKKNADAANLLVLSLLINFLVSLFLFFVLLTEREGVARLLHMAPEYVSWLFFIPLSVFLFAGYQPINFWLIRSKAFHRSSVNKILRRGTEASVQVMGGVLKRSYGMVAGDILGNLLNFLVGVRQLKKTFFTMRYLSWRRMKELAGRYKAFPIYNLFPALLNTAASLAPVFFIKHLFTDSITGYFDLTRTVLVLPMALLSVSVSQALFQKISEFKNLGKSILQQILPLVIALFVIAIIEVLVIFFFGEELFAFFFGKAWGISGRFARILVFGFALKFVISPLSISLLALEKIRLWSMWQVFYFIGICSLVIFDAPDIDTFLYRYLIIDIFAYILYALIIASVLSRYEKRIKLIARQDV